MQKLSLQLACRYFADSNVFIAGSWCFGALVISLYLLTWGEKTNVLCNIYYIYTRINACFWGVVLVFWLALKPWFDFLLAAVFLTQSVFPYSAAPWPGALLGACVKADLVQEVHLARLEAEDAQPWWARGAVPRPWHSWLPRASLCLPHRSWRCSAGIARMTSEAVTWICQICTENMWTCLKYCRAPL